MVRASSAVRGAAAQQSALRNGDVHWSVTKAKHAPNRSSDCWLQVDWLDADVEFTSDFEKEFASGRIREGSDALEIHDEVSLRIVQEAVQRRPKLLARSHFG